MAKTVAEIQVDLRFETGNDTITITSGTGLAIFNKIYRDLVIMTALPEFRVTLSRSAMTTVASQSEYNWPS